jgi:predicted metal-binding membrane protein
MSDVIAAPLQTQRRIILALLLSVAAASWALLLWQAAALDMSGMGPTMGLAAPLFLAVWVVMMVAMMFPTAAPMVLIFHQVQAGKRQRGETFVATWVFVAAYLIVWTLAGIVAYGAAVLAEMLAQSAGLTAVAAARIGGALLVVAGLYQLTPLKSVCLSQCRTPIGFIMTSWRDGLGGALRMGVEHGLYCLGCCWLLFVILFPLGIMNVAAMAVITVLIFAEKAFPWGVRIAQVAAAALVLYGIAVLFVPSALPTFMAGQNAEMPSGGTNVPASGNETLAKPAAPDTMPSMKM